MSKPKLPTIEIRHLELLENIKKRIIEEGSIASDITSDLVNTGEIELTKLSDCLKEASKNTVLPIIDNKIEYYQDLINKKIKG
jgi:hypothetical protein